MSDMATNLTIGWLGNDSVDVHEPARMRTRVRKGEVQIQLRADWAGATLAETLKMRDQLAGLAANPDQVWPFTWVDETRLDGFVRVLTANVDTLHLSGRGAIRTTLTLEYLGREPTFQSILTGAVIANDKGITDAESAPFHALPKLAVARFPAHTSTLDRDTDDAGDVTVFRDVTRADNPRWRVMPASFLAGGARFLDQDDVTIVGTDLPAGDATDWTLTNGALRIRPSATAPRLDFQVYDGTVWEGLHTAKFFLDGAEETTAFEAPTILHNSPELTIIRLTWSQDAAQYCDLTLRRGSYFATGYFSNATATSLGFRFDAVGTAVTPPGATGAVGATKNTAADTHRALVATANGTVTAASTEVSGTTTLGFAAGIELAGASAVAGNAAADVMLQYLGNVSERVAIR